MKKMKKISKIFLVLTMIFSQLSSVVTVLADEVVSKPLETSLSVTTEEELGYIKEYNLTYKSEKQDYEEEKEYTIELEPSFKYLNGTIENGNKIILTKTGYELNNETNTQKINPIYKNYNGENTPIEPTSETLGVVSTGEYTVSEEKEYTQNLIIEPGNLSPNSNYRVSVNSTEIMTGSGNEIVNTIFDGSITDTTSSLGGLYTTSDTVTIEELNENNEVINTINYTYNASINYNKDNDRELSGLTGLNFHNGYLYEEAIGYNNSDKVTHVEEILGNLINTDIELSIYDENNELLDLTNEEVINSEVKNNYKLVFKKGTEVTYTVVVIGDNNNDNNFNEDDMKPTMNDYLEGNKVLSMDVIKEDNDEEGLLTFEDIMRLNTELNPATSGDVNTNLGLVYGELPKEIYVGDTFKLNVLVKSENASDYINGINALVTTGNNLKLTDVT